MMAKKLLGDAVKEERLRRNLSQNALAEMVHVSLRTISDIENYNGNPRFENLYLLASYLNLSIDAVFNGENEPMDSTMKQIIAELNQCSNETPIVFIFAFHIDLTIVSEYKKRICE